MPVSTVLRCATLGALLTCTPLVAAAQETLYVSGTTDADGAYVRSGPGATFTGPGGKTLARSDRLSCLPFMPGMPLMCTSYVTFRVLSGGAMLYEKPEQSFGPIAPPDLSAFYEGIYFQAGGASASAIVGTTPLPVELVAFAARADGRTARLSWTTASETNNAGFVVERQTGDGWADASPLIAGRGTTTERSDYAHALPGLAAGRHTFRLRQTDTDGTVHHHGPLAVEIGVENGLVLRIVGQKVWIEADADARVTLVDVLGRTVATQAVGAGAHEVRLDGAAPGRYVVRAVSAGRTATLLVVR